MCNVQYKYSAWQGRVTFFYCSCTIQGLFVWCKRPFWRHVHVKSGFEHFHLLSKQFFPDKRGWGWTKWAHPFCMYVVIVHGDIIIQQHHTITVDCMLWRFWLDRVPFCWLFLMLSLGNPSSENKCIWTSGELAMTSLLTSVLIIYLRFELTWFSIQDLFWGWWLYVVCHLPVCTRGIVM